jgi:hypothetical protein
MESRYAGDPINDEPYVFPVDGAEPDRNTLDPDFDGQPLRTTEEMMRDDDGEALVSQAGPLGPTWSLRGQSEPGMDDLAEKAGKERLTKMSDALQIYPFQSPDIDDDRLFLARYEFPKLVGEFTLHPTARPGSGPGPNLPGGTVAFIDFLCGFPSTADEMLDRNGQQRHTPPKDCIEMLVFIGEISSKPDPETGKIKVDQQPGKGKPYSPVWEGGPTIFSWPEREKIIINMIALPQGGISKNVVIDIVTGETKTENLHWWVRQFLKTEYASGKAKFPVPGEFFGLGVRLFPGERWGYQKSSPFLFSGNFFDTVYLTAGVITAVIEPTDTEPYCTYEVRWHKEEEKLIFRPTDFAEYKVDDWVSILKDVATEKKSQLWKDDDMETKGDNWMVAPFLFYGYGKKDEEE